MSMEIAPGPTAASQQPNDPIIPSWASTALIIGGIVIVVAALGGIFWFALTFPDQIEAVRDVFIMAFALMACATIIVLVLLLVAVIRLINMLEFEIKPILEKTNQTVTTLQATTTFVSNNIVQPAITVNGYMAGVRKGLRTLFGNPRNNLPR